jgi:hypothetical protein
MSSTNSSPNAVRHHLQQVRSAFLRLHKALLDSERILYEQFYGRIPSSGEFFRLVIGHEWFNWLRPMSQFIASVDETLSTKEPLTLERANELLEEARRINYLSEDGTPEQQRYYYAIQRDPNIAIMYVEVGQLLAANPQQ